jgi:hypothetical protein
MQPITAFLFGVMHSLQLWRRDRAIYLAPGVERPRTCTKHYQSCHACYIEQVAFIARRSKLSSSICYVHELDRTESIGKMDSSDCHDKQPNHGNGHKRHKSPDQYRETAQEFDRNRQPRHNMGGRYAQSLQDYRKDFGSFGQLCNAVCHKTISDDQSQRKRSVFTELCLEVHVANFLCVGQISNDCSRLP